MKPLLVMGNHQKESKVPIHWDGSSPNRHITLLSFLRLLETACFAFQMAQSIPMLASQAELLTP